MDSLKITVDQLYEKAETYWEYEDNYSNITIVAVIPEDDKEGFLWGYMYIEDEVDLDPEDYPKFYIKNRFMTYEGAKLEASRYYYDL